MHLKSTDYSAALPSPFNSWRFLELNHRPRAAFGRRSGDIPIKTDV